MELQDAAVITKPGFPVYYRGLLIVRVRGFGAHYTNHYKQEPPVRIRVLGFGAPYTLLKEHPKQYW